MPVVDETNLGNCPRCGRFNLIIKGRCLTCIAMWQSDKGRKRFK